MRFNHSEPVGPDTNRLRRGYLEMHPTADISDIC